MSIARKILMGSGGKKDSTYIDDVFSTYLYKGNNAANTVNTGINYSEEGGLLWIKARNSARQNLLFDTVRGANKKITSNEDWTEYDGTGAYNQTFTTTGFTVNNSYTDLNDINVNYTSWNFRKQKGFFDIVTWSGNDATTRTLNHGLGSIPGCFMVKRLTGGSGDWVVYHRDLNNGVTPEQFRVSLNNTWAEANQGASLFGNTAPTSTQFTVGDWYNHSGSDYLCYLFAGGASTAATARSVDFDGNDDLTLAASTDLDMGTGDFTVEFWYKGGSYTASSDRQTIIGPNKTWGTGFHQIRISDVAASRQNRIVLWDYDTNSSDPIFISNKEYLPHVWRHVAVTRTGGKLYVYVDGTLDKSISYTAAFNLSGGSGTIIGYNPANTGFVGELSNLRVVKGTAVYTSSFRPPIEPLTNITNTKLLCCNNSSTTGSTVTPGTITANGNPTASTDSPFDDPEGFKFGEGGDQNIIKCGGYKTDSNEDAIIDLGWEPQWVLAKRIDSSTGGDWMIYDSLRGLSNRPDVLSESGMSSALLEPSSSNAETNARRIGAYSSGFVQDAYGANREYIYIAIRRPDGYVGKPAEAGTDVFAMDRGSGINAIPVYDSGFPVDLGIYKVPASSGYAWWVNARLRSGSELQTNSSGGEGAWAGSVFDSNTGWATMGAGANVQSWMWKRHAGFDVVVDKGNGATTKTIAHGLGVVPEMIWRKNRDNGNDNWQVYHIGLNGGTNPHLYRIYLNTNNSESNDQWTWDSAPTATHFTVGSNGAVNRNNEDFITFLFASVEGISKCGYYDGQNTPQTITTGFQPRFIIIKSSKAGGHWYTADTLRGWTSSSAELIQLDQNAGEMANPTFCVPTSTGFTLSPAEAGWNENNYEYIYYAHA